MAKKEAARSPEKDLAAIIVFVAMMFAVMSFSKHNITSYAVLGADQAAGMNETTDAVSLFYQYIPLITYVLLLLLVIFLLTYLIRRHFAGHSLSHAWEYSLYSLLVLSILCTSLEYFLHDTALYPAVFAIAAIIAVFILDALLARIPTRRTIVRAKSVIVNMPKESVFERLKRHAIKPAEPGSREMAELKQVLKDLKGLKRK